MAELHFSFSGWLFDVFFTSQKAGSIALAIWLSLSSSSPPPPQSLTFTPCHLRTLDVRTLRWNKMTTFWWINLYILGPIPVSASILQRPRLLLSWGPPQPSGVISLLAVLNSLIICVLHKKRTIPQWHNSMLSLVGACFDVYRLLCCVCTLGFFRLSFSTSLRRWDKMWVFLLWQLRCDSEWICY